MLQKAPDSISEHQNFHRGIPRPPRRLMLCISELLQVNPATLRTSIPFWPSFIKVYIHPCIMIYVHCSLWKYCWSLLYRTSTGGSWESDWCSISLAKGSSQHRTLQKQPKQIPTIDQAPGKEEFMVNALQYDLYQLSLDVGTWFSFIICR